ncbi:MAG: SDR family oxidoreductase [Propionicimonas sp.]|nr:SDR family oxidoreductase [Propionicimonas sp.]
MSRGTVLAGARVLITGGTRGIGRLMAAGAVQRGAVVTIWARDAKLGGQVAVDLGVRFLPVDVTDPGQVAGAAAQTGAVDVLVNNAGVITGKPFLDLTEDEIRRTYEVNVLAQYRVTQALLPGMLQRRRGHVVTIASASGLIGSTRMTDYSGSKHAMVGFTEALRAELRQQGSPVNTLLVCPFYIDTGMFAGARTAVPWLLPILSEQTVATKVLDAVERGSRRLLLPPALYTLPLLRLLPVGVADAVIDLLGVNHTMDDFTGRQH